MPPLITSGGRAISPPWRSNTRSLHYTHAVVRHTLAWTSAVLIFSAAAQASTIVVANNSDLVNGDTSSPAALARQPGPDGISLREAIETANRSKGGSTTITFATGTVHPLPAGSECGRSIAFAPGTAVQLQTGPYFTGWAGHADCLDGVVLMQSDIVCEARFGPPRRRAVGR